MHGNSHILSARMFSHFNLTIWLCLSKMPSTLKHYGIPLLLSSPCLHFPCAAGNLVVVTANHLISSVCRDHWDRGSMHNTNTYVQQSVLKKLLRGHFQLYIKTD